MKMKMKSEKLKKEKKIKIFLERIKVTRRDIPKLT